MSKLLVVDDEIDIVEIAQKFFTRRGVETFTASGGHEAIRMIQEKNPDLILLDYNLPGLTGKEILKKIREELKLDTKVIVVTGMDESVVIHETESWGIHGCIRKPIDLDKLEEIVQAALNPL
jgi:two-component system response regulator HydG